MKNINPFEKTAYSTEHHPSDKVWLQLENKLNERVYDRKIRWYRYFAFAASFIVLVGAIFFMSNSEIFHHRSNYQVADSLNDSLDSEFNSVYTRDIAFLNSIYSLKRKVKH